MSYPSQSDVVYYHPANADGRVYLEGSNRDRRHRVMAELSAMQSDLLLNPTVEGLAACAEKKSELTNLMEEAVDNCFARVRNQDVQMAELKHMMDVHDRMCEENQRRQERIRQKDLKIAQLATALELGRRLCAEAAARNAEKRAKIARLEEQIRVDRRRIAQGLPPIPDDDI
ncbi:hypothetical protein BC834DRAFT_387988 [Gloeopeniophorella convolvens]|nr:hypothetical protein BC834DRAFT_387988 [Gloeopeniophorella convolvens]